MLTPEQLSKYLSDISFPDGDRGELSLDYLTKLQRHHQARVPFESLSLHYSRVHLISLDLQDLYKKIVGQGMGVYCMENNKFFSAVLQSLGFTIFTAGGRVSAGTTGRPDGRYSGWSHMVNIVTIAQQRYLVDVGFGADGPIRPLPLLRDGCVCSGIGPQSLQLEYKSLVQHTDPSQRVWVFSHRAGDEAEWTEAYCFIEVEFFPEDYEVMNLSTMTLRRSWFTQTVLCVTTLFGEGDVVEGVLILVNNEVKKRIGGVSTVVETLGSEGQRVQALEKWFGIVLSEQEKKGIIGLPTELRA